MLQGNTPFALALYRRLAESKGNLFFSPQSIATSLAMVAAGARGETLAELERVLHLPLAKVDDNAGDDPYELVSANALWAAGDLELSAAYVSLLRREFGAPLEGLDFANDAEDARRRINTWVAEATRQKITELIGRGVLQAEALLVLTNAIYMKAAWLRRFSESDTDPNVRFTTAGGVIVHVTMMKQTGKFGFLHAGGLRVLELPYRGDSTSMLLVLPDAVDGLRDVEQSLTKETFAQWRDGLSRKKVEVSLPRFSLRTSLGLVPVLQAMGIQRAFDRTGLADFSGISPTLLSVSDVIHEARIDVSEKGTEATAATAVMKVLRARIRWAEPESFRADHPFLFAIVRRGSLLFLGRLTHPGQ